MENEHFMSFKNASKFNFPLVVGPFIIKNKFAFVVVEIMLHDMNFMKSIAVNYDAHHVISQRRQFNKKKEFEHQVVEGLVERDNWMEYHTQIKDAKVL